MPLAPVRSNLRTMVSIIFGVFFLANVLLLVMAVWSAFGGGGKAVLLPEDMNPGVRILIFVVGAAVSWFLGRWLFLQMVDGNMGIDESSNAAFVLMFYLMLLFLGFAFMSAWTWLWQAILLIVLILLTLFILRRILREVHAMIIMAVCLVIGVAVYVLFK
ncbi:MAG TPA: hypothetical protein VGD59_12725 [Acidisarcina sp.]